MELLERIGLLAGADELDWLARDLADGKRAAAAGVAVHLRHDDAVEIDAFGEGRGHVDHVLAGHGVDDHEDLVGFDRRLDGLGLFHHLLVYVQAARRVDDDHVAQVVDGVLHAALGDGHRVLAVAAEHAHADFVAERFQLIGCSGAVNVASSQQRAVAFLLQTVRQLSGRGGFTRALQAHQHDDVGDAAGEHQLAIGAAEQLGELVGDDLDDVLRRGQGVEHLGVKAALLRARHELLDHLEVDVGFEHGHAHLAHGGVDVVLGQAALAAQAREDALQAIGKVIEHEAPLLRVTCAYNLLDYSRRAAGGNLRPAKQRSEPIRARLIPCA